MVFVCFLLFALPFGFRLLFFTSVLRDIYGVLSRDTLWYVVLWYGLPRRSLSPPSFSLAPSACPQTRTYTYAWTHTYMRRYISYTYSRTDTNTAKCNDRCIAHTRHIAHPHTYVSAFSWAYTDTHVYAHAHQHIRIHLHVRLFDRFFISLCEYLGGVP